jgi:DNA invertase Pin-like site-specific DNA recombinase
MENNSNNQHRNAVIYCRVSSLKQGVDGISLEAQEQLCVNYCNSKGKKIKK